MKYCVQVRGPQSTLVFNAVISTGDRRGWRPASGKQCPFAGLPEVPRAGGPSRHTLTRSVFFRIEKIRSTVYMPLIFVCLTYPSHVKTTA